MKISQEMLNKAMKKAVEVGIFPKESDMDTYLKHWQQMEDVLTAALQDSGLEEIGNAIIYSKVIK